MKIKTMRMIADSRTGSGGGNDSVDRCCYQAFTDMCEMKIDKLLAVAEAAKAWRKVNQYPGPLKEVHLAETAMIEALEELEGE